MGLNLQASFSVPKRGEFPISYLRSCACYFMHPDRLHTLTLVAVAQAWIKDKRIKAVHAEAKSASGVVQLMDGKGRARGSEGGSRIKPERETASGRRGAVWWPVRWKGLRHSLTLLTPTPESVPFWTTRTFRQQLVHVLRAVADFP